MRASITPITLLISCLCLAGCEAASEHEMADAEAQREDLNAEPAPSGPGLDTVPEVADEDDKSREMAKADAGPSAPVSQ